MLWFLLTWVGLQTVPVQGGFASGRPERLTATSSSMGIVVTIAAFVVLAFLYSLVSRRLEHTVITAPIAFTAAGMLFILVMPGFHDLTMERETFRKLAEIGL